jgi:hypothetical protein
MTDKETEKSALFSESGASSQMGTKRKKKKYILVMELEYTKRYQDLS